jgi:hypothetical protein
LEELERGLLQQVAFFFITHNRIFGAHLKAVKDKMQALHAISSKLAERSERLTYASCVTLDYESRMMRERLTAVRSAIQSFLVSFESYYACIYEHRAFFELYEYESMLCGVYKYELQVGHAYGNDLYRLEKALLQGVGSHNFRSDYPLVAYREMIKKHIQTLRAHIDRLPYYYVGRSALAQQLCDYLCRVLGIIENTPEYKEQKKEKREYEERQLCFELHAREVAAREREAHARELEAVAQKERARQERERNRIDRINNGIPQQTFWDSVLGID